MLNEQLNYSEVLQFMREYGCDFITAKNELIIDYDTNTYAELNDCKTIDDVKAKVLMSVCRPIGKGLGRKSAERLLKRFNDYFECELTREDMRLIYGHLCYSRMLVENKDFIRRGFPMDKLRNMEAEGIAYADLYNPDDAIHPQSR